MPAGRSNALLEKANSQLRGERIPIKAKEEDEIAVYLQSLSQRTQVKKVGYEDHGDISISSGVNTAEHQPQDRSRSTSPAGPLAQQTIGKKFLKKKRLHVDTLNQASLSRNKADDSKESGGNQQSMIIQGKKKKHASLLEPVKTSLHDEAIMGTARISNRSSHGFPLRRPRSGGSESDESISRYHAGKKLYSADMSIRQDGNHSAKGCEMVADEGHCGSRSPSPQMKCPDSSLERKEMKKKGRKSKGEIVRTLGKVFLTSEEESLAEFIHGLSTSEATKKPQNLVTKKQQKWRKKSPTLASRQSASPILTSYPGSPFKHRSPSPLDRLSQSHSQDSDVLDSMTSEMLDDRQKREDSTSSEDDKLNVNLMSINSILKTPSHFDLGWKSNARKSRPTSSSKIPHMPLASVSKTTVLRSDSLTDHLSLKTSTKDKKFSSKTKSHFFESIGIQMADDLLDVEKGEGRKDTDLSEESEILTEKSQDRLKPWKKSNSKSEMKKEIGSMPKAVLLTRDTSVEEPISERLSEMSSMRNIKFVLSSEEEQEIDTEVDYSESFFSESETMSSIGSRDNSRKKKTCNSSYRHNSKSCHKCNEHKVVMEKKCLDIAATDNKGQTQLWNTIQTGFSISGRLGLQYVDPTPVASHVVSADALEALSAYSPNTLALQDMMRSQLQLICSFNDIQGRIYSSCVDALREDHIYTTLQNTKEFINKNSKASMTMKVEEALRLVDLED